MVNAQEWLDREYPKNGVYKGLPNISFNIFSFNTGKSREEIKSLDIWAITNLGGSLKLEGFTNLEDFNCWGNSLTELDLSDCPNLKKINCNSNNLRKLTLGKLEKLTYLDCSNNKLTELDTSDCPRLERLICDGNQLNLEQSSQKNHAVRNLQLQLERETNRRKFAESELEKMAKGEDKVLANQVGIPPKTKNFPGKK